MVYVLGMVSNLAVSAHHAWQMLVSPQLLSQLLGNTDKRSHYTYSQHACLVVIWQSGVAVQLPVHQ